MLPSGALASLDILDASGRPDDRLGPARRQAHALPLHQTLPASWLLIPVLTQCQDLPGLSALLLLTDLTQVTVAKTAVGICRHTVIDERARPAAYKPY